jgi:hypothetical protein
VLRVDATSRTDNPFAFRDVPFEVRSAAPPATNCTKVLPTRQATKP